MISSDIIPDELEKLAELTRYGSIINQLDGGWVEEIRLKDQPDEDKKIRVHAGILNSQCSRMIQYKILHYPRDIVFPQDPIDHDDCRDSISQVLRHHGYEVEQEYYLEYEFERFVLVHPIDLYAQN